MAEGDDNKYYTSTDLERVARETAKNIYELQKKSDAQTEGSSYLYTYIKRELDHVREDISNVDTKVENVGRNVDTKIQNVSNKIDDVVLERVGAAENRITALEQKIQPIQRMFWLIVGIVATSFVTGVTTLLAKGGI